MPSVSRRKGPIHLGLDVHKDSISVAILEPHREAPEVGLVPLRAGLAGKAGTWRPPSIPVDPY